MSIQIMPLTATQCKKHKHDDAIKKLNYLRDGHGLYLEALPNGRKVWRFEFRIDGKKSRVTLPHDFGSEGGTLTKARAWREKQRELVRDGISPAQQVRVDKITRKARNNTFGQVADEWLENHRPDWSPRHYQKAEGIVLRVLRPTLEHRHISEIDTAEVLAALEVPQEQGKRETAHKARLFASQIFRRAIVRQLIASDPTYALTGKQGLKPVVNVQQPQLTNPEEVGELLRKIDGYQPNHFAVPHALKLIPYVFTRPGELRQARWKEFDLVNAMWEIPAERMKARKQLTVPLATQVLALLEEIALHSRYGADSLLFPSPTKPDTPITDSTMSKALRSLGYQGKHVPHGFRHTASTLLNNQQLFSVDAIEVQLAHSDSNKIRGTYNKAQYLPERRKMMQYYADYLDGLKTRNPVNVVAFKSN